MTSLKAAKKELRQLLRRQLASVTAESIEAQSRRAIDLLLATPEYRAARRVSVYLSMPTGEISTRDIVYDALDAGKKVFVPWTHKNDHITDESPRSVMDMVALHSRGDYDGLEKDAWGIPTPAAGSIEGRENYLEKVGSSEGEEGGLDLIIMPGMAFDRGLKRLGHGKGFYDFFLWRYHQRTGRAPFLLGLALQEQLMPEGREIPSDSTDWPVDALIVGNGSQLRRAAELS